MIEINFGISKDINTNDSIEEEQDKLYDEVEKGIEKYIESLFILSKEFDEKSKKFEEMKKKQQMNRFD